MLIEQLPAIAGVRLDVLRLDRMHTLAPGNKWFKLAKNVACAERRGVKTLVSFGGRWSNHLHALAAVGRERGINTLAFVRGRIDEPLTACLQDASDWGMQLQFLSHGEYRRRHDNDFVSRLLADLERPYLIPEGGANALAVAGCAAIVDLLPDQGRGYTKVMLACGTGTTLAGLVCGLDPAVKVIGIPVLKNAEFLERDIRSMLAEAGMWRDNWHLDYRYHGGGFGRIDAGLIAFVGAFEAARGLPLDPVYTAKLFRAAQDLCVSGQIAGGERVLLVHTGGLQGRRGYPDVFADDVDAGQ